MVSFFATVWEWFQKGLGIAAGWAAPNAIVEFAIRLLSSLKN